MQLRKYLEVHCPTHAFWLHKGLAVAHDCHSAERGCDRLLMEISVSRVLASAPLKQSSTGEIRTQLPSMHG